MTEQPPHEVLDTPQPMTAEDVAAWIQKDRAERAARCRELFSEALKTTQCTITGVAYSKSRGIMIELNAEIG